MEYIKNFASAIDECIKIVDQVGFCMKMIPSSIIYLLVAIIVLFIADRAYVYWKMELQEKKMDAFIEGKSETAGV